MTIREMITHDWDTVMRIYKQGIDSGLATFSTHYPSWEEWDSGHRKECRYVAISNNEVVGFIAISSVSQKPHYSGISEVMVYVDESARHMGVGTALLQRVMEESPKYGCWMLYSSIMSSNAASIRLHDKCGFRTVGYRERIARDKNGEWQDTTIMEYRFPDEDVVFCE